MDVSLGKRLFLFALVGSLTATAAIAVFILLFAEFDDTAGRILGTTALVGAFCLLALPCGVLLDQARARPFALGGLGLCFAGFLVTLLLIWDALDDDENWKLAGTLAAFAVASSQTAAVASRRRRSDPQSVGILYALSIVAVYGLAVLAIIPMWGDVDDAGYFRFVGAVAVVDVLLVLLQPVVRRLGGGAPAEGGEAARQGGRLVFAVDSAPSQDAVDDAVRALERGGARVTSVELLG